MAFLNVVVWMKINSFHQKMFWAFISARNLHILQDSRKQMDKICSI